MRRSVSFAVAAALCSFMCFSQVGALPAPAAAPEDTSDVIVILRDQISAVPASREARAARASAIVSAQGPMMAKLQLAQARNVHAFKTINAIATTLPKSEVAKLAADPSVQAVVANKVIRLNKRRQEGLPTAGAAAGGEGAAEASSAANASAICNTLEPEALQLTHAAYLDASTPQAQEVIDGDGKKVTGTGVKVAFIADGLDTNVLGFTRPDGSKVFVDYKDFSGDPAGTPTAGGEAFGDASSIAAQDHPNGTVLTFDIGEFNSPAYPPPKSPCKIQIRGMAPGASLVGLKVFSQLGYTTTSAFVQAIEYAVLHDVDVINESFGSAYYPDDDNDPTSLANSAAVRAGVTVVVSSGDAGTDGTLGSPSTDPDVIEAGATTQYRLYAQTGYPGGKTTSSHGYVDNNISAFSSGGFAQTGARTVDIVAPGEDGWALCSTDTGLYQDCTSFAGTATPIEDFGGTSESAPLTSGEAALIIQAYRSTHHGVTPSPALVKTIIKSTAVDLFAPASEQGSGLIDALSAVHMALAFHDQHGGAKPTAPGVSFAPDSAALIAAANSVQATKFTLTNDGDTAQRVTPTLQKLAAPFAGSSVSLELNAATDPQFTNDAGGKRAYIEHRFNVPSGTTHLDVEIAYQNQPGSSQGVYIALLNADGKLSNYSVPQGNGTGFSHVEAVNPVPGAWTAIIWTHVPGDSISYSGPVQFTWSAEKYVNFGSISPASIELQPGQSASFTAHFAMPSEPGDTAAAIRFGGSALQASIPISLRTLIPIGATGGEFTGTLTGTNGRGSPNPVQTYEFDVPAGVQNLSLALNTADSGYLLSGELIDPNGIQVSVVGNLDPFGDSQYGMSLFRYNPQAGRWRFLLIQNLVASGNQTSLPFTARVAFNSAQITAPTLPDSASVKLSASGKPVVVPIQVVNTAAVTEAFFADARLSTPAAATITVQAPPSTFCVAFKVLPGGCGLATLPTQVTEAEFIAASNVPINMDAYPDSGYYAVFTFAPDVYAGRIGHDTVAATLIEPEVPSGLWVINPALVGPYKSAGASTVPVSMNAKVRMLPFDPAVSADSGDVWADEVLGTSTYNPLILAPGEAGIINVTIKPNAKQVGDVVKGYVFIDTYSEVLATGDEVVRVPYSYTIAK